MPEIPTGLSGFDNDMGYIITETDPTVPAWAKASTKPTYTASEVGALPSNTVIPTVPTNVSAFTNDAGYLTSYTETDPTVPAWAKAASKPTYTAAEVGALPDTYTAPVTSVNGQTGDITVVEDDHKWNDVSLTKTSQTLTGSDFYVPYLATSQSKEAKLMPAGDGISAYRLVSRTSSGYILSTTPPADDNSTKVATTAFVNNKNTIKTTASENNAEYNLLGTATTNNNTSAVNVYNQDLLSFAKTSSLSRLTIGSTASPGVVRLYTSTSGASGYTDIKSAASGTTEHIITLPDASGTVALTTDIPSVPSWALNSTKPSYTFSELTSHPTTLNDYGITDAYTKTEVDGLVSGVLHYKGTKSTTSALPSSGNVTGDVWHITADGSEWAWDGSAWQELGTAVDLSGYLQSSDIAAWAKASTKPSYTASEVGALASSTTYVSSFNGSTGAITYTAPVTSVNGQTGAVTITDSDENVKQIDDTSNANALPLLFTSTTGTAVVTTSVNRSGDRFWVKPYNAILHSHHIHAKDIYLSEHSLNFASGSNNWIKLTPVESTVSGRYTLSLPSKTGTVAVIDDIPSVPSWALESTKPSYTASEVGAASATHAHGNITSGGDITTTATIASGDRIIINDESASKVTNSSITFGSSTAQYLANNGTWQNVPAAYDDTALAARVTALEQIPWVTYYTGSTTPSNAQGNNGDLYFQTSQ